MKHLFIFLEKGTAYNIGYQMGRFLPFVLIALVFIWLLRRRSRRD